MGNHFQSDIRVSFPGRARVNRLIKLNIKLNMHVCDFSMLYFKKLTFFSAEHRSGDPLWKDSSN